MSGQISFSERSKQETKGLVGYSELFLYFCSPK